MAAKKVLKTKHFQHPDDLVAFVNNNGIADFWITPFDRFQALYYYDK